MTINLYKKFLVSGFDTIRGELVRSILYPKPMDFHIYSDFLKLIFLFFILGVVAVGWSLYVWLSNPVSKESHEFDHLLYIFEM